MDKIEIENLCDEFVVADNDIIADRCKDFSVGELERLVGILSETGRKRQHKASGLMKDVLSMRALKLNHAFEWTAESCAAFKKISDGLDAAFELAYKEAAKIKRSFDRRIAKGDPFLTDYEIEINITPYLAFVEGGNEDFIYALCEPDYPPISYNFGHRANEKKKDCIFLDKTYNWNIEWAGGIEEHIGYASHALLDQHWSLSDILNITRIWTDIKVYHQREEAIK